MMVKFCKAIGLVLFVFVLAACGASPTPTATTAPTNAPTATVPPLPTPTRTVRPQTTRCYSLAQSDCTLLLAAISPAALTKINSFALDYSAAYTASGLGKYDGQANFTGTGVFSGNQAGLFAAVQSSLGSAPDTAAANQLLMGIMAQFTAKGDLTRADTGKKSGSGEVRIVNGDLYTMSADFDDGTWKVRSLLSVLGSTPLGELSSLPSMGAGGGPSTANPLLKDDIDALRDAPGFIKLQVADGPAVDGQTTRKFTADLDAEALFNSPQWATLIADSTQGDSGDFSGLILKAVQRYLSVPKFQIRWLVSTAESSLRGFGVSIVANVPAVAMMLFNPSGKAKDIDVSVTFDVQMSKVGQPVKVEPVPDAIRITPTAVPTSTPVGTASAGATQAAP